MAQRLRERRCFLRDPRFSSQHPYAGSQLFLTPVSGMQGPLVAPEAPGRTYKQAIQTYRQAEQAASAPATNSLVLLDINTRAPCHADASKFYLQDCKNLLEGQGQYLTVPPSSPDIFYLGRKRDGDKQHHTGHFPSGWQITLQPLGTGHD